MPKEPARKRARSKTSKGPGAVKPSGPLSRVRKPSFDWREMERPMAGVDEAGRGCLAGPVVAAAVILPDGFRLKGLTDSKLLTPDQREHMEPRIKAKALAWSVGVMWPRVIDDVNILQATFMAMHRALTFLKLQPASITIDGDKTIPSYLGELPPQRALVDGDVHAPAVSAASVLAKTFRDRIMIKLDRRYPGYGFASNKGYGAKAHLLALRELGPCRVHRLTFRGVLEEKPVEEDLWLPGI